MYEYMWISLSVCVCLDEQGLSSCWSVECLHSVVPGVIIIIFIIIISLIILCVVWLYSLRFQPFWNLWNAL